MDSWTDDVDENQDSEFVEDRYGGKNTLIFLIDVASLEMHQQIETEDGLMNTRLQMALKCVHATLRRKVNSNIACLFSNKHNFV